MKRDMLLAPGGEEGRRLPARPQAGCCCLGFRRAAHIGTASDVHDFNRNRMRSLDYDKVRRFAFSIQTEPSICVALDAEPCGEGEAWEPQDEWITSMC